MPQTVTFSVSAKVDKTDIKSEAKFEVGSFTPILDELLCKCSGLRSFDLPPYEGKDIEMILITADPYMADKNCLSGGNSVPPMPMSMKDMKRIQFGLTDKVEWTLSRPIIKTNLDGKLEKIYFNNEMTVDAKVSVLVLRKTSDPDAGGKCCASEKKASACS